MMFSRSLGLWSGISFINFPIEVRNDSILKNELNTTTSATRLQRERIHTNDEPNRVYTMPQVCKKYSAVPYVLIKMPLIDKSILLYYIMGSYIVGVRDERQERN